MNSALRQQAVKLRVDQACSYSEIRKRLGVSKSTLSYWLRDLPLSDERLLVLRRQGWHNGEVSREKFRATMRKKREAKDLEIYQQCMAKLCTPSRDTYYVAGLMLYLGEGDKKQYHRIGLANTDRRIIQFFIKWMVDFLDVNKDDIRVQLQLYENMDIEKERKFWKEVLKFHDSQFYKVYMRKLHAASFSYKESYRHGTCGIFFTDVNKKRELMMGIQAFLDLFEKQKGM